MRITSAAVNSLWTASGSPAWLAYRRALRTPERVQKRVLLSCLRRNADTAFGRAHGFASIRSVTDFQRRLAPSSYDDVAHYVHRAARGEPCVLTKTPIERLVPSSGSTAAAKFIPFTQDLRAQFTTAIDAWLVDLFRRKPSLISGPSYWSISPLLATPRIPGCVIPTGFDSDSRYLGAPRQALARCILAVPDAIARVSNVKAFQYLSALFLLHARDLRIVSLWHPSFFERLLDCITANRDRLVHDIQHGTLSPSPTLAPDVAAALLPFVRRDRRRADELRSAGTRPGELWPHLSLISCWADGPSAAAALQLARRCEGIPVQSKGLLATEGVVTIPFGGGHPIAIRSHFFEFVGPSGRIQLAHELQRGIEYSVLLTTGGGLYRYKLGDRVRVNGFVCNTPSLQFVGKDDRVSDLFGEKLSDGFVAGVLERLFPAAKPQFALLAPSSADTKTAYTLFVSAEIPAHTDLALRLEHELRRNPHYAWCVDLGQLAPARITSVASTASNAFVRACADSGQRLGDIKPVSLSSRSDWHEHLPIHTAVC